MTERRENIARALAAADKYDMGLWCSPILCVFIPEQDRYRRLADAAIAADGLQGRVWALIRDAEQFAPDDARHRITVGNLRYAVDGADSGSATT